MGFFNQLNYFNYLLVPNIKKRLIHTQENNVYERQNEWV